MTIVTRNMVSGDQNQCWFSIKFPKNLNIKTMNESNWRWTKIIV